MTGKVGCDPQAPQHGWHGRAWLHALKPCSAVLLCSAPMEATEFCSSNHTGHFTALIICPKVCSDRVIHSIPLRYPEGLEPDCKKKGPLFL